jgi:hypothetical protein
VRYEVDFTNCQIASLKKLGLVWNMRWHAPVRMVSEPLLAPEVAAVANYTS